MGGFGSGRSGGKDCTDNMCALDVRKLQRERLLTPGKSLRSNWSVNGETTASINLQVAGDRVTLSYRQREHGSEWRPMNYSVRLEWTRCHFGGQRAWWLCPASGCARRVAVLHGGTVFACRHCHQLAYRCQRESRDDRAARRADAIRRQLGWQLGILNCKGLKPKGMHWRTFEDLQAEHDAHVDAALSGMADQMRLLNERLGGIGRR